MSATTTASKHAVRSRITYPGGQPNEVTVYPALGDLHEVILRTTYHVKDKDTVYVQAYLSKTAALALADSIRAEAVLRPDPPKSKADRIRQAVEGEGYAFPRGALGRHILDILDEDAPL